MTANMLIEASAGTGKTQALAERLITLLKGGVKPQEIVALTFSRAAAGEIFERFVSLLATRVGKDPEAAALLREVIATQHLSQIGTLDSFLMRIVRSFPLELGLTGKLEMMDEYASGAARARVSFGILRRTGAALKRAFNEAFQLAMDRENVRSFTETFRSFVAFWHRRYLALPDPLAWGDAARLDLGAFAPAPLAPAALARLADSIASFVDSAPWREFVAWVRDFRGTLAPKKGFAAKFFEQGAALFAGAAVEISYNRKSYVFGGAQLAALREVWAALVRAAVWTRAERARGIRMLVGSFESEYAARVRGRGRLVFDDVPRLILALDENARRAIEYRLDARIRAWALDEFQDTSREQWRALTGLLDEAKQSDGEKSVFIVGDRKQAIYGWRNGDVGIFTGERESGAYEVGELKRSWRYGPPIAEAVNRVFVHGRLRDEFPGWEAGEHESAKPELGGFVQAVEASGAKVEDFAAALAHALAAVDPVSRGLSAAILVRANGVGMELASRLKAMGIKGVVWEGESDILDTPALMPFLDTLCLADHPGDRQAYEHFRRSPLAQAKYGAEVPEAAVLSETFALDFATQGLVRTFRGLRALLPEDPAQAWSAFTEERFTDLLRAAAEFEGALEAGVRLGDFIRFLRAKKKRNVAEPGKIKILTIHRSKGLGFDYVLLPLYEPKGLAVVREGPLVGEDWILPDPGAAVTALVPKLRVAAEQRLERVVEEELCAYYVAMTRAVRAMTVVLHPSSEKEKAVRFSQFVREALPEPLGDPGWYFAFDGKDWRQGGAEGSQAVAVPPPLARGPRQLVRRRLPSLAFHSGESAGRLFAPRNARKLALAKGTAAHAEYEHLEFLEASAAKTDFERALVKPADFVALWRERAFEVFVDGQWVSGRFDRVVFTGAGAARSATIYDFKTNARLQGETEAAFAARLRATYAGQMDAYRRALAALTELAADRIRTVLLATVNGAAIVV